MKYEKALGKIVEFDNTDIITTSTDKCNGNALGKICKFDPGHGHWSQSLDEEGYFVESEFEVPGDTVIENPVETPAVVEESTITEE